MTIELVEPLVRIARDVIAALAAVTGATVAVIGLRTWRRQLRGGVELETARLALRAAYKMRDAIKVVRNPFHDISEIVTASESSSAESHGSEKQEANVLGGYERPLYAKRWQQVLEAGNELRAAEIEGEVLWGRPFIMSLDPLTTCVHDLSFEMSEYLRYREMEDRTAVEEALIKESARTVKAKPGKDGPDEFERRVDSAIENLEAFVRPRIELKLRSA